MKAMGSNRQVRAVVGPRVAQDGGASAAGPDMEAPRDGRGSRVGVR